MLQTAVMQLLLSIANMMSCTYVETGVHEQCWVCIAMLQCKLCCENFITAGYGRYGSYFMWKTVARAMLSAVFI